MPPKVTEKKKRLKEKKRDEQSLKISRELKEILLKYDEKCTLDKSSPHPGLRKYVKHCAENGRNCTKLILDKAQAAEELQVKLAPLITAIRSVRYQFVKEIYVWDIHIKYEDVAALANFLENPVYSINYLEFIDCKIDYFSMQRLSRSLNTSSLTTLLFDYNQFGDEGCKMLCLGLQTNKTLIKLSLCYCDLRVASGSYLGKLVSESALSELYLDGNKLECEGMVELIKLVVDKAEQECIDRSMTNKADESHLDSASLLLDVKTGMSTSRLQSASSATNIKVQSGSSSGKKKRKKSTGKKKTLSPPKVGPWLAKLHIADNGIDAFGIASKYAPVIGMRLVKKWIANSADLKELDIDDNLIGDLGGREILDGLQQREQSGLSAMKIWITQRINSETFSKIMHMGSGGISKRKKKRKGKPGKVKMRTAAQISLGICLKLQHHKDQTQP